MAADHIHLTGILWDVRTAPEVRARLCAIASERLGLPVRPIHLGLDGALPHWSAEGFDLSRQDTKFDSMTPGAPWPWGMSNAADWPEPRHEPSRTIYRRIAPVLAAVLAENGGAS